MAAQFQMIKKSGFPLGIAGTCGQKYLTLWGYTGEIDNDQGLRGRALIRVSREGKISEKSHHANQ